MVWNSVTQQWKPPYTNNSLTLCRVGRIVTINGNVKFTGGGTQNYTNAQEHIPEAFRPLADQSIIAFPSCGFSLLWCIRGVSRTRVSKRWSRMCRKALVPFQFR